MNTQTNFKNFFNCIFSDFLLVLFCTALPFQQCISYEKNNWVSIDSEGLFFINELIFPRDRHLRRALEMQNFSKTSSDGVNSMELFTEYDCKKGTFRLLNHRAFSNKNLNGELIHDWKGFDPRAFVGIPSNSPTEKILYLVCGYERKI